MSHYVLIFLEINPVLHLILILIIVREDVFESPRTKRKRIEEQENTQGMDDSSSRMDKQDEQQPNSYAAMAKQNGNNGKQMDGITPIQNQNQGQFRPRRKSALMYGKSKDDEVYLAADVNLVASGVSKDATESQLNDFLKNKGLNAVAVEKLTQHPDARTNTFKITIKPADYENALNPNIWPYRVAVRHFIPKRFPAQDSWQKQSQQTGGRIQDQPQQNRQHQQSQGQQSRGQQPQGQQPQGQRRESFQLPLNNRFDGLDRDQN